MPILKQLVSGSSQSKRRSRADLTAEMISAPLGDFRHTMHVGRGGDAFGDTSFLSTRSGEPPREPQTQQSSSPKQGLLSRTFRSSKRSQSANRPDHNKSESKIPPSGGSPGYVKTAISLPYLNNEENGKSGGPNLPKSISSSPVKNFPEVDHKQLDHFATGFDPELDEHNFGVLTDLPVSLAAPPYGGGGGMKHAESILSFHVDLGPSMLGDILSVMDKKGCDEDSFGFEEDLRSPPYHPFKPEPEEVKRTSSPSQPINFHHQNENKQQRLESCSMSSSGSADEIPNNHQHSTDNNTGKNRGLDDRDFSYMDDDDDEEIRV